MLKKVDDYLKKKKGNPCCVLPTGSGKTFVIASFIQRKLLANQNYKLLMVTHQKELIEQNDDKLLMIWPEAPIGIYSASVGEKDLSQPITMAGIQSLIRANDIPGYDYVIVDECHMINNEDTGSYRKLFHIIEEKNPAMRVIGLTATPYRLGQGMITDEPAIFSDLIQTISTLQLQERGYLAWLSTKQTEKEYDTTGIAVRGGEFVEKELQERVVNFKDNEAVCDEIVRNAVNFNKKHILIFCTGIKHSMMISEMLCQRGMKAEYITGEMDKPHREDLINRFVSGEIQVMCHTNVLSTGFDYSEIDMIVWLRPTMSTALFVQGNGRGLRKKKDGGKCLVLDFAGNTKRLGPINSIVPPKKKRGKKGKKDMPKGAPTRTCPVCHEIFAVASSKCPSCGWKPPLKEIVYELSGIDINGTDKAGFMFCSSWYWYDTTERKSGQPMLILYVKPYFQKDSEIRVLQCINSEYPKIQKKARKSLMEAVKAVSPTSILIPQNAWRDTKLIAHRLSFSPAPFAVIWEKETNQSGSEFYRIYRFIYPDSSPEFLNLRAIREELEKTEPLFVNKYEKKSAGNSNATYRANTYNNTREGNIRWR